MGHHVVNGNLANAACVDPATDSNETWAYSATRSLLLDIAQSDEYACVSPFAVIKGLDELCKREGQTLFERYEENR